MQKLIEELLLLETGVILFSGPSNCGKTQIVKAIAKERGDSLIVSAEQLIDSIIYQIQAVGNINPSTFFVGHSCVCIEDIDWYRGRSNTLWECSRIINHFAEKALVIVTGVDLTDRMSLLLTNISQYDLYEYNESNNWICTKQKRIPPIFLNRSKLLKLANDTGISAAKLNELLELMNGKSDEEKEKIAMQIICKLESDIS